MHSISGLSQGIVFFGLLVSVVEDTIPALERLCVSFFDLLDRPIAEH